MRLDQRQQYLNTISKKNKKKPNQRKANNQHQGLTMLRMDIERLNGRLGYTHGRKVNTQTMLVSK